MTEQEYIDLISKEPLPEMVEQGNGYRYIKKSVLKRELLRVFGGHTKFEVTDKAISKNGLYGSGVLHYRHPVTNEWLFETGMAAIPHQTVMKMDYPALKAQIFKNAVREIGVWFGQNLNLEIEDAEPQLPVIKIEKPALDKEEERMRSLLQDCKTKEELITYKLLVPKSLKKLYSSLLKKLPHAEQGS